MLDILLLWKNIQKELQRIKILIKGLDYDGIDFSVRENDFGKIEKNNNICINVFGYEDWLVFPKYISNLKFENSMDLLFVTDGDRSH